MPYTKAGRRALPYPQKRASVDAAPPASHGGARPGAGRKPKLDALVTRAFSLRQDQDALITLRANNRGISKSEYLRQVIDAEHKSKRV